MGITMEDLIRETLKIMQDPLKEKRYIFSKKYFRGRGKWTGGWGFGFRKKLETVNLYAYIEFQPDGFSTDDLFELAINLLRLTIPDFNRIEPPFRADEPVARFDNRLTPAIYDPGGRNTDQWWHFTTIETLQKELLDIYDKLINFGIPYLEDLNSKDVYLKFYGKPK